MANQETVNINSQVEASPETKQAATVAWNAMLNQISFGGVFPPRSRDREEASERLNVLLDEFLENGHDVALNSSPPSDEVSA